MNNHRTILRIPLRPAMGARFQPTGFPDLGPALFQRPADDGWVQSLHVESPQSMANHLESTTWDVVADAQSADLEGIPYVAVSNAQGEFLTSSRLEAHRLACAYIMEGKIEGQPGEAWLEEFLGLKDNAKRDQRALAQGIFQLDPVSLIHGVFFARKSWPWQPKIARALTCFIDADNVLPAISGGVKTDSVSIKGQNTDAGYGMVPHQRTEFTAQSITAYVAIDHQQIRSYGLSDAGTELLESLIQYELAHTFHPEGMRLRTACDLVPVDAPSSSGLMAPDEATSRLRSAVGACGDQLGPVRHVVWEKRQGKSTKVGTPESDANAQE